MHLASLFWLASGCSVLLSEYKMASGFSDGLPASAARFPFVVGVYYWPLKLDGEPTDKTVPFCTGTIVTVDWVITSYRCIKESDLNWNRHVSSIANPGDIKMVAGTAYAPANEKTFERYKVKTCSEFKFPELADFKEIFNLTEEKANERVNNKYDEKDVNGKTFHRYFLDYAALKADTPWKITRFVQTAPFPVGFRDVIADWWSNKVNETKAGIGFMEPCYAIGWGGWDESVQQLRLRYTKVKFVPYSNCDLTYCTECSYCNNSMRINPKTEVCYKSYYHGDACPGDEGAPVWCPWFGFSRTRTGHSVETGSVLGFLSFTAKCSNKSAPPIYHHSWNVYPMMTRIRGGAQWPPDMWIYSESRE